MLLILVRHAEAEEAGVSGSDFTRKLTPHGHASALAVAHGLRQMLSGSITLWSSPLLRTQETAHYLAQALEVEVARYHEAIPAGDLGALQRDWQALPVRPDTLIVVGHQPHLGIWATRLTGVSLPVKKASVLGMHLSHPERLEGELHCYALPEMLAQMRSNARSFGV